MTHLFSKFISVIAATKLTILLALFYAPTGHCACEEVADFVWSLRNPDDSELYVAALDTNGNFYLDGELTTGQSNIESLLSGERVIWRVRSNSTTTVAAIYENDSTGKFDMVISGEKKEGATYFAQYSTVADYFGVVTSTPLLKLKHSNASPALSDGSLIVACSVKENRPVGFFIERWDVPEQGATPLAMPAHFTFIPGQGNAMFVNELYNHKVRLIDTNGNLKSDHVVDFSSVMASPAGQHGLMGIACHPQFADAQNPKRFVYVYGTDETTTSFPNDPYRPNVETYVNRIWRFEVNAQMTPVGTPTVVPGSPAVYAGNTNPGAHGNIERLDHTGGNLRTYRANDKNYLLLSTGCIDHECDQGLMSGRPQDVRVYPGKLLRYEIDSSGNLTIPADNPFVPWLTNTPTPTQTPTGTLTPTATPGLPLPNNRMPLGEVIAGGFRNPFTFCIRPDPTTGVPIEAWVANVGGVGDRGFEELDRVDLRFTPTPNPADYKNYGFPRVEGNNQDTIPYPTPGYEMYDGASCGDCPPNYQCTSGDLSDKPSFPYVEFADLASPAVYYERFSSGGSIGGAVFISKNHLPNSYKGDLLSLDWVHGTIFHIDLSIINSGVPYRIETIAELTWLNSGDMYRNLDMLEGPNGDLFYSWNRYYPDTGVNEGKMMRLFYVQSP